MNEDQAQILALKALSWMATQDDILGHFLGAAGTDVDTLKSTAGQTETQLAVLDFLLMQDDWVAEFCRAENLPPEAPMQARQFLPGGAEMHWT